MKLKLILSLILFPFFTKVQAQTEETVKAGHSCYTITNDVCGAQCCRVFKVGSTIQLDNNGAAVSGVIENSFTTEYGFIAKGGATIQYGIFIVKGTNSNIPKLTRCTLKENSLIATIGFSSPILYKANTEVTMQGAYFQDADQATSGTVAQSFSLDNGTIIPANSFIWFDENMVGENIKYSISYKTAAGGTAGPFAL